MLMLTLQPELMEQLESVAIERSVMPDELLEAAVRAYLRQVEREQIKAEAAAFRAKYDKLRRQFIGQYVAIYRGEVVDHDPDFQALHSRIRQRYGRQPVLLRRVEREPERTLVFRSPRFEQIPA
jgi:hypothetical protein